MRAMSCHLILGLKAMPVCSLCKAAPSLRAALVVQTPVTPPGQSLLLMPTLWLEVNLGCGEGSITPYPIMAAMPHRGCEPTATKLRVKDSKMHV